MKNQSQKSIEALESRTVEYSEKQVTSRSYSPPRVLFAGKAKRLMAAANSGNNIDCIQRYYFC